MNTVKARLALSLDGYVAGPEQSEQDPLGVGGYGLHEWAFAPPEWRRQHGMAEDEVNPSTAVIEDAEANIGAGVMGRNMFGPERGPWSTDPWRGWWGEEPPYHHPVFVLTQHAREPLQMAGGTTFTFVTDGMASALDQARAAAGDRDIAVHGGGSTVRQALAAGVVDELLVHVVPVLLGAGVRLFEDLGQPPPRFAQAGVIAAPGVTHVTYRLRG